MARKNSGQRTMADVLEGEIPIACSNCGHKGSFNGKKEYRSYFNCRSCGHAVMLTSDIMTEAKFAWSDEIRRRSKLWE